MARAGAWVLIETKDGIDTPVCTCDMLDTLGRIGERHRAEHSITYRIEPSRTEYTRPAEEE